MTADTGRLTRKQIALLEVIQRGNEDGSFVDMEQLIDRIHYKPSRQSLQCSIRAMEARGLVERKPLELRRGRHRVLYALTPAAVARFDATTGEFDIISEF